MNPVRASATTNVRQAEPAPKVSVSPRLVPAPQTSELEAIDDAEFGGEYLPSGRTLENARLEGLRVDAGRDVPAAPVRLEDDLRLIEAYLDRPNTPAIVRSEVIAAELGIDDQRSERALERLSENRERVSRIRKGAYMVKSAQAGQSSRL